MSGLHDLNKPFWQTSMAVYLLYAPVALAYASFVGFPIAKGEWAWATHGLATVFYTGLLAAGVSGLLWHIQASPGAGSVVRKAALATALLAFVLIAAPAILAKNSVLGFPEPQAITSAAAGWE